MMWGSGKKRLTKERAMLGIWADSDEEDYAEKKSKSSAREKRSSQRVDLTKPIQFVSSGVFDLGSVDTSLGEDRGTSEEGRKRTRRRGASSLGKWQEYTKGIGSKLLLQMGWKGGGLGRDELGTVDPIQVRARKGRAGLQEDEYRDAEVPSEAVRVVEKRRESAWRVGSERLGPGLERGASSEAGRGGSQERCAVETIVDMRGPQVRILSGYEEMKESTSECWEVSGSGFLPELQHNVDCLVRQRESRSGALVQKKRYEERMVESLNREKACLIESLDARRRNQKSLGELIGVLQRCWEDAKSPEVGERRAKTLESMREVWANLLENFREEYRRYKLESLAFCIVFPLVESEVESWDPLGDPEMPLKVVLPWKELLSEDDEEEQEFDNFEDPLGISQAELARQTRRVKLDTFNRMMYEIILPKMRSALLNEWNPQEDPDAAINLIEVWRIAMSKIGFEYIAFHVVLKKLKHAIENWTIGTNLSECPPIDTWVLPWVPVLGGRLSTCYEDVRYRLQSQLVSASPSECISTLSPWKRVFSPDRWARLIAASVVPKLEKCLSSLVLDPGDQNLVPWRLALAWRELASDEAFALALRNSGFWRKWFSVLGEWIHQEDADFDEIQQWYSFWKNLLPSGVQSHPHVKAQLGHALRLMLDSVSGNPVRREQFRPMELQPSEKRPGPSGPARSVWREASFKEAFSSLSEEHGLLLMPTSRAHDGNAIYQLENISVYFYKDLVFSVGDSGSWEPTSVDDVIRRAKSKDGRGRF